MRTFAVATIAIVCILPLRATVVLQPTLEELVREAREILVTEAVSSRAAWRSSSQGRFIETTVTFKVDEVIKGQFTRERSMTFLGGRVGDLAMGVSDMVEFTVGDRDVLFVDEASDAISPLVGFNSGRFRITRESNVLTHDDKVLGIEASTSRGPSLFAEPMGQSLTLTTFIAHIRATATAAGISLR